MRSAAACAVDLLARREHSRARLAAKLEGRGHEPEEVNDVLDRLQAAGYLDDRRFAESFVRGRVERGQGPLRILAGLREHGVDGALAQAALDGVEEDWVMLCARLRAQRFGAEAPQERRAWLRQARFLAGRGFSEAQVRTAMRQAGTAGGAAASRRDE